MSQFAHTSTVTLDLIRHGEPVGGKRYRGQLDDPLSERGWQQMHQAIGQHAIWDRVLTSPLLRCADFAQQLTEIIQCPLNIDARLSEIGFGDWEGKTAATIEAETPQALINFWQDPVKFRPPNAELLSHFEQRVTEVLADLVATYPNQRLLVVTHAGVIRMVLKQVIDFPIQSLFRIHVPNAGITRIVFYGDAEQQSWPNLMFHAGTL